MPQLRRSGILSPPSFRNLPERDSFCVHVSHQRNLYSDFSQSLTCIKADKKIFFAVPADGGKFIVVFCAEFNPIPEESTGRFEDVIDGSLIMLAMTEPIDLEIDEFGFTPPFNYTWDGEGWLEF